MTLPRALWMLTALCWPMVGHAEDAAGKGLEIAEKVREARDGFGTERMNVTLVMTDSNGNTTERRMQVWMLEVADDGDRSRMEVTWPADVQGTRLLTWSHPGRQDDQWLYLPAVEMVKRIAGGNRSASFMGSEFSFEDFSSFEVENYTYEFLEDTQVDGRDVWAYARTAIDKKSGYGKQVMYTDKEYLIPVKVESFDRKMELLKVTTYSGFFERNGRWYAKEVHATNAQTGKESRLVSSDLVVGEPFDENLFMSHSLGD